MAPGRGAAEWRDAAAYAPLLHAERPVLAWEWLRRDPSYRETAAQAALAEASMEAERWGVVAFEDPRLAAPAARPLWSRAAHALVLEACANAMGPRSDAFELDGLSGAAKLLKGRGTEHLLISDGVRMLRLDILAGTLDRGPAVLTYRLAGLAAAEKPLLTLRRFLSFVRAGRFSRSLHPRDPRARRQVLMLRAWDALQDGADQRQIAAVLLSGAALEPRWRNLAPSLRSQAQRLVRGARRMAAGAYRELLD